MIVSTKGRYALRVMLDLASHKPEEYVSLASIAERQGISEKYLENIIKVLTEARLLKGVRGKGGGYRLSYAPEDYTIYSILKLTEGNLAPVACLADNAPECNRSTECRTLPMWRKLDVLIKDYFSSITLADLLCGDDSQNDFVI